MTESPRTLAIRNQGSAQERKAKKEEHKADGDAAVEDKALKIPETQIRKYWKSKEEERIAPRVHQTGLSVNEKILRHFDLSSQYGVNHPNQPTNSHYPFFFSHTDIVFKGLTVVGTALYRYSANSKVEASGGVGIGAAD